MYSRSSCLNWLLVCSSALEMQGIEPGRLITAVYL